MVFSSITFLFYFLPATLLVYFLTPPRWRNIPALAASLAFFSWGAPRFVFVLVGTCFADYHASRWLAPGRLSSSRRRGLLAAALVMNLGLLGYFKYANFFVAQISDFLGIFGADPVQWTAVALPIGISFFTFQKVSYLVDVYRGTAQPSPSAGRHLLYIALFPQLIAGPIVRYHDVSLQLENRSTTTGLFLDGLWRFGVGLAKKVLVANTFAYHFTPAGSMLETGALACGCAVVPTGDTSQSGITKPASSTILSTAFIQAPMATECARSRVRSPNSRKRCKLSTHTGKKPWN